MVITFLPRSKCLLISWLQSPSAMILKPLKLKSATVFTASPTICHKVMGPDAMFFVFWMLSFKLTFSLSSFTFIKKLFSSSSLSAISVVSSAYLRLLIFLLAILSPASASFSPAFVYITKYKNHKVIQNKSNLMLCFKKDMNGSDNLNFKHLWAEWQKGCDIMTWTVFLQRWVNLILMPVNE